MSSNANNIINITSNNTITHVGACGTQGSVEVTSQKIQRLVGKQVGGTIVHNINIEVDATFLSCCLSQFGNTEVGLQDVTLGTSQCAV